MVCLILLFSSNLETLSWEKHARVADNPRRNGQTNGTDLKPTLSLEPNPAEPQWTPRPIKKKIDSHCRKPLRFWGWLLHSKSRPIQQTMSETSSLLLPMELPYPVFGIYLDEWDDVSPTILLENHFQQKWVEKVQFGSKLYEEVSQEVILLPGLLSRPMEDWNSWQ